MFSDKEVIITILAAAIILLLVIILFISVSILYTNRQKKHLFELYTLKANYNQELLKAQLEIQEQTFQNISQEIHDNIGQVLTLAKLNLNTVEPDIPQPTQEKIQRSKDLVSKAITDLRDLSKSLNTDLIREVGLHEIIRREISMVSKTGQYETVFNQEGEPFRFDKQKELIIFRILQEILNNIIKHSKAKTLNVRLQYIPEQFSLTVSDDGEGFDAGRLSTEQHFGLGIRNMQNRASLIGARIRFNSSPGAGTSVLIQLPIENDQTSSK